MKMARSARIDLRSFQDELATRLAAKTAAQVESSRLGLACGGERWLMRLGDAAEVIAVPPIAEVPLTQPWFRGLANIRGNLYTVVDLAGFLGRATVIAHATVSQSRLIIFGPRAGELRAGVIVHSVLGLRNLAELAPMSPAPEAPAWYGQRWADEDGGEWQEIELPQLAEDARFLHVGL